MPTKILITGAGGYLGSSLSLLLADHGYEVLALDLPGRFRYPASKHLSIYEGDISEAAFMKPLISRADMLIPLAALVGAPACDADPVRTRKVNLEAVQMIEKLRSRSQGILFPMTNNGYRPAHGESHADEDTPFKTDSLYTQTKFNAEQAVLASGNSISLRLASLFGVSPGMRSDLLVHFFACEAVHKNKISMYEGDFKRSFVSLHDVTAAFLHTVRNFAAMKNNIYNVALEEANISKKELAMRIKALRPSVEIEAHTREKDPDARDFFVSSKKIKAAGFAFTHSLDDGLREVLSHYETAAAAAGRRL